MNDWQEFELLVKNALEEHYFESYWNVNLTLAGKRRQFDIIARKRNDVLGIDCKFWDNKKTKASALIICAQKQKERCLIAESLFGIKIVPLIVTDREDLCGEFEGICIVPLDKLRDYLLENY